MRRGALRALVAVRDAEPEAANASLIQRATGYDVEAAAELRRDLANWSLVTVQEGYKNKIPYVHVRLTDEGRRIADLAKEIDRWAVKARDAKHKG